MTDTPSGVAGPVVRVDVTASDATAAAAAARIAALWLSTGVERERLVDAGTRASLYVDITRRPAPRPARIGHRPRLRTPLVCRYRSVI
ncbi:DUF6207 family protein, partial [Streptomyces sp. NPDC057654]|uniref:DUF6207 family protein n=1 Tax=Streptomyces sp. NPDC057654 TaxID=3346196 RepID=UPI00369B085F